MNLHSLEQEINNFWDEIKQSSAPDVHSLYIGQKLLSGAMGDDGTVYAADFFRYAAEQGNVDAMYELAMCYRWGDGGVYVEPEEALSWLNRAGQKGHPEAKKIYETFNSQQGQFILLMSAVSGIDGSGSKWYKSKLFVDEYYNKANAGDAETQYELGVQLENPKRVGPFKHNITEALYWYEKAANNGVVDAMFNLGVIYKNGRPGVPVDLEKAKHWFGQAAMHGDKEAQQLLERMLSEENE